MLKLYHTPISFNSRRVWVALLEKGLKFELVQLKLDGDQFQPEFLEINPFHHIPVLVDEGFNVVDSLAILDYLEAKYPTPALLPTEARSLGIVRMVQMVTVNELVPAMTPLIFQRMGGTPEDIQKLERLQQQLTTVLTFFERLIDNHHYFGGEHLTLADIVAGTVVPILPGLGVSLSDYPQVAAWTERLNQRPAWVETQPSPKTVAEFRSRMASRMANRADR